MRATARKICKSPAAGKYTRQPLQRKTLTVSRFPAFLFFCDDDGIVRVGIRRGDIFVRLPVVFPALPVDEIAELIFPVRVEIQFDGKGSVFIFFQRRFGAAPAVKIAGDIDRLRDTRRIGEYGERDRTFFSDF